MNIFESLRISLRALRANKLRSILTMLGIIIGVAAVIAMVGIGTGASNQISAQIQGLGSNLLIITPGQSSSAGVRGGAGSGNSLVMSDLPKIQAAGSAVKRVAPATSRNAQVVYGAGNTSTSISGTTADYAEVRNVKVDQGRFLTAQDDQESARVAVVGPTVVQNLMGDPNANILGKIIKVNNVPFQVVGVTASQGSSGFMNNDDMIFVPLSTAQMRLIGNKYLRQVFVEAASPDQMQTAQDEITAALERAHRIPAGKPDDFTIMNQADILSTMQGVTQTMTMLLGGIAAISLLVGGIGIMNIMLVSVTERTREIGIRKAIGAKGRDIMLQFLIEAVVLCILGGGVGILLGYGGSRLVGKVINMATSISMVSVIMAFGFSALIGIVFGVFPARKAAGMDPIEALRYE